jgi:hypothetical protein
VFQNISLSIHFRKWENPGALNNINLNSDQYGIPKKFAVESIIPAEISPDKPNLKNTFKSNSPTSQDVRQQIKEEWKNIFNIVLNEIMSLAFTPINLIA